MLEVVKEMFIQSLFKNKNFLLSKRTFLEDYSRIESKQIDMTLSGKYLSKYDNIEIDIDKFDQYPSHIDIKKLENKLKEGLKTNREIILGAGANGILQNLVKILFKKKGNLVTPYYTFNQVEFATTSMGCFTRRVYNKKNYKIDFAKMKKAINSKTRMIYICNPNNPTGIYEKCEDLIEFARSVKIPVVVDESGIEFSQKASLIKYSNIPDNLLIVRSFSKAYGIANFRIGYLICCESIKEKYLTNITTNEFSGLSCIIANNLLEKGKENVKNNINYILKEKKLMIKELNKMGIKCIHSETNTLMTETTFNKKFLDLLEENDVSVVPVIDENGFIHIRIAIQDAMTNSAFLKKLTKINYNNEVRYENIISYKL